MALLWLALDDTTTQAMSALARLSWKQEDLDNSWRLAGWPEASEPPSRLVFERHEVALDAGERRISLQMNASLDLITGFLTDFAVFYDATGPADPDLVDLIRPQGVYSGWRTDAHADRARFDDVWADACQWLEHRLGVPELRGRHGDRWQHAAWRISSRLLIVAQGEDFSSHSLYDAAYLAVVDYPVGANIPAGDGFYGLLLGRWAEEEEEAAADESNGPGPACPSASTPHRCSLPGAGTGLPGVPPTEAAQGLPLRAAGRGGPGASSLPAEARRRAIRPRRVRHSRDEISSLTAGSR